MMLARNGNSVLTIVHVEVSARKVSFREYETRDAKSPHPWVG